MSQIPRGTHSYYYPSGAGTQAVIVFPAIPGITWVLTEVNFSMREAVATAGAIEFFMTSGGVVLLISAGWLALANQAASVSGPVSWSGELPGFLGQDLTVQTGGSIPNAYQFMDAAAYNL